MMQRVAEMMEIANGNDGVKEKAITAEKQPNYHPSTLLTVCSQIFWKSIPALSLSLNKLANLCKSKVSLAS